MIWVVHNTIFIVIFHSVLHASALFPAIIIKNVLRKKTVQHVKIKMKSNFCEYYSD